MTLVPTVMPIERGWLQPGAKGVVEYPNDEWTHERLFLWPIDGRRWVVETGDGDVYDESLRKYSRLRRQTGKGDYPDDVRQIVAFPESTAVKHLPSESEMGGRRLLQADVPRACPLTIRPLSQWTGTAIPWA